MPSWFDLMTLDASGPEDEAGIKKAFALVLDCLCKGSVTALALVLDWTVYCYC